MPQLSTDPREHSDKRTLKDIYITLIRFRHKCVSLIRGIHISDLFSTGNPCLLHEAACSKAAGGHKLMQAHTGECSNTEMGTDCSEACKNDLNPVCSKGNHTYRTFLNQKPLIPYVYKYSRNYTYPTFINIPETTKLRLYSRNHTLCVYIPETIHRSFICQKPHIPYVYIPETTHCAFIFQKPYTVRLYARNHTYRTFIFQKPHTVRLYSRNHTLCVYIPETTHCAFICQKPHI